MATEPKKTKPTVRALVADLKALRSSHEAQEQKLAAAQEELEAFRQGQSARDREFAAMEGKVRLAKDVLKVIHAKTREWEWPPGDVEIVRPLTFGDIKRAAEVAGELQ